MGGQARFKVHPSSHGREGKPTSQEAICIGSHSNAVINQSTQDTVCGAEQEHIADFPHRDCFLATMFSSNHKPAN